jgi:hypothetical protein
MKPRLQLDRYTTMGDLTSSVRLMLRRANYVIIALLAVAVAYLFFTNAPGATAFLMIAAGAAIVLLAWTGKAIGLPLLPMLAVQHLVAYGLPILVHHKIVTAYPAEHVVTAGLDVLIFLGTAAIAWRLGLQILPPGSARAFALEGIDREGIQGLKRLGFSLITISTLFLVLQSLGVVDQVLQMLPSGVYPVLWAGISATSTCGFFLVSMIVTSANTPGWQRAAFWTLLTVNCLISASGFLLSAAATTIISVMIGQFWSTGRVSARFVIGVLAVLAFLNLGKFTMRERYWHREADGFPEAPRKTFADLPAYYLEWSRASYDALTGTAKPNVFTTELGAATPKEREGQSLLERINNLQNLLFVIDTVETGNIAPLRGATYSLIPPLLIPRFLWPSKPRTHEGQVLLNTHFGRQDLQSTFTTYIAWGLLPEAFGNFGAVTGALLLGIAVGVFCAWMETVTARKPLLSTEGFVAFAIFLGLATSYEMVASVMITSIFQAVVPITIACMPFVRRTVVKRPDQGYA